jgi:hypothetical protein
MNNDSPTDQPQTVIQKFRSWYHNLPEKKRYLELITAVLSIPVLITVIISNVNNLNRQNAASAPAPDPTIIIREVPSSGSASQPSGTSQAGTPSLTPSAPNECIAEIGPIEIASPEENQTIQTNPVCIDIVRNNQYYCSVVWAYRINGSPWSEYTNKSICLYDMPSGNKLLELRIKSVVTGDEIILKRNFVYGGTNSSPTPTIASQSAGY